MMRIAATRVAAGSVIATKTEVASYGPYSSAHCSAVLPYWSRKTVASQSRAASST